MEASDMPKKRTRKRFLLRGESVIASSGLVLAAILLACMGATAYWTLRVQRMTLKEARSSELESLGALMSETAQLMLSLDEVSTLRRIVVETARDNDLRQLRIVLADGAILADAEPSRITLADPPRTWPKGAATAGGDGGEPGVIALRLPFSVRGRGDAVLLLEATAAHPFRTFWEAQAGVAAIGSAALLALLVIYRRMRSRLTALGAIREALLAVPGGEREPAALALRDKTSPEARAWNQLMADNEKLRKKLVSARAEGAMASRSSADSSLQDMCDAMRQGIVLVDSNLKATYANGAAAVYLGTTAGKIAGAAIAQFIPDQEVRHAIEAAVGGTARSWTSVEIDRRGEGGGSVLRYSVRPLRREDAAAAMVAIHDVTQQRVADEARNMFITHVTHELRTPLTNIRLYAETAIEEGEDDPQVRAKCLNVVNQEARRLESIVNDMLSVAEIEAGTMELRRDDVHLDALFEDLQIDYAAMAGDRKIALKFDLPPKLPVIHADREKLGLALHNLVGNAIKYSTAGGSVVVKVDTTDDKLSVDVADTGIGISETDLGRIFERFYRAKDPKVADITGSGIGLSLAREVVRLHGGDIRVESQVGKGSTFSVNLPLSSKAA